MARRLIDIAASGADDGESIRTLLTCVASVVGDPLSEPISRDEATWTRVFHLAVFHGVCSILYHGVASSKDLSARCPASILERLRLQQAVLGLGLVAQLNELGRIDEVFRSRGVESLTVKGVSLAAMAYSPPRLRRSGDIDILVPKRQFHKAAAELIGIGYQPVLPDPVIEYADVPVDEIEEIIESKTGMSFMGKQAPVDLHWTLDDFPDPSQRSWFPFSSGLDPESALASPAVVEFENVQLRTLPLEDLVLYLCFHGAKHNWCRLAWIADIAAISQKQTIDWNTVFEKSKASGNDRLVHVAVLLATGLLGAKMPQEVLRAARSDLRSRFASRLVAKSLFSGLNAMQTHTFRALAFQGLGAKKTYLSALVAKRVPRRPKS